MELEDPIFETSFFISLMTGVPDAIFGVESYRDLPVIAKSSIEERWQLWGERFINATKLRKYNMPSPYQYQNWRDWAFQMMLSVNHG